MCYVQAWLNRNRDGSVALTCGKTAGVFRKVPAQVCPNRGEYYLDAEVSRKVMNRASAPADAETEVEIIRYAA